MSVCLSQEESEKEHFCSQLFLSAPHVTCDFACKFLLAALLPIFTSPGSPLTQGAFVLLQSFCYAMCSAVVLDLIVLADILLFGTYTELQVLRQREKNGIYPLKTAIYKK